MRISHWILLEIGQRGRNRPDAEPVANNGRQQRDRQGRTGQCPGRQAGGAHHRQFPVGRHALIDKLDHDVGGDRQDHGDEAGDQQAGQLNENQEGQASVDHQIDEAQRLGQPDQRRQTAGGDDQRQQHLTENIDIKPGNRLAGTHEAFCGRLGWDATGLLFQMEIAWVQGWLGVRKVRDLCGFCWSVQFGSGS